MNRKIVCQREPEPIQWTAWFEDTPQVAFGGPTSSTAIIRLLDTFPKVERYRLEILRGSEESGSMELALVPRQREECPDCGGSGKYTGLNAVEDCAACKGSGQR